MGEELSRLFSEHPLLGSEPTVIDWLQYIECLKAPNTTKTYAEAMIDFLRFCAAEGISAPAATAEDLKRYQYDMEERPRARKEPDGKLYWTTGLCKATIKLRLAVVNQYHADVAAEYPDLRPEGKAKPQHILPNVPKWLREEWGWAREELPQIPTEKEWDALRFAAAQESLRNRVMFMIAYDTAMRRVELVRCRLEYICAGCLTLPAAVTKNRKKREIDLAPETQELLARYLEYRSTITGDGGCVWLSESPRNFGQPITEWTWYDVVAKIAEQAKVRWFHPHTMRHQRLTDLAIDNWSELKIAAVAGHRSTKSTMKYIHLSGRETSPGYRPPSHNMYRYRITQLYEALSYSGERDG
jgi:integrase